MRTNFPPHLRLISLVAALSFALASPALAGKGAGGGGGSSGETSSSISLVLLNSTDGLPHVGQKLTFNVSTTATSHPWASLDCYQSGALVYKASNGIFPTSLGEIFTLASNSWTSGAADCTAYLQDWDNYSKHGAITNLASMSFHVYG
jgi:hypothetical protein